MISICIIFRISMDDNLSTIIFQDIEFYISFHWFTYKLNCCENDWLHVVTMDDSRSSGQFSCFVLRIVFFIWNSVYSMFASWTEIKYLRFHYYHWVEIRVSGLFVPAVIISPACMTSTITCFMRYIYIHAWYSQFLTNMIYYN